MPTLRQLSYLVAIADEGHFGRAANRANVAQPTLSAQFAALERKLGVRLVERGRNGVSATPLGREVVERSRKVLGDIRAIVDLCASEAQGFAGSLKLGVPPTLGPYLLPHVIPDLHKRFPQLKLYVREGKPRTIEDALASGEVDLILTPLPVQNRSLEVHALFDEPLLIVCAPDHPFAAQSRISQKHLKGQKVLTLESGHHLHDRVRSLCDTYSAELLYNYEGTSLDTLRHMVGMGVGISFFPELYILSEIRDGSELKIVQLNEALLSREIFMAWRSNSLVGTMAHEIIPMVRAAFSARHTTDLSA